MRAIVSGNVQQHSFYNETLNSMCATAASPGRCMQLFLTLLMKRLFYMLPIVMACRTTRTKNHHRSTSDQLLGIDKNSQRQTWVEYRTKDSIPFPVHIVLDALGKKKFEIANPDEPFQVTDAVLENLPSWLLPKAFSL